MRVYILSEYQENGAYNVMASTDKSKLLNAFGEEVKSSTNIKMLDWFERLKTLLDKDELDDTGTDLGDVWGGYQLHIVELL